MRFSALTAPPSDIRGHLLGRLGFLAALAFLLVNLVLRAAAAHAAGAAWDAFVAVVVLVLGACVFRPVLLRPTLVLFGTSFFLYGFHSYRLQNQAFELIVTALALVLLIREARVRQPASPPDSTPPPAVPPSRTWLVRSWLLFTLLALASLLLLPRATLSERAFLEGYVPVRATLAAFPDDPLYPFAAVNRLVLLVVFAALLSRHPEARRLYRALFRGIACSALLAVALGLLEFFGFVSLAGYNLSHLFYGSQYRRLQSTFGNPAWFACYVSCALPFVLLELWEARRGYRAALAAFLPLCAASLFLSGARAAWLASIVFVLVASALISVSPRWPRPLPPLGRSALVSLAVTVAGAGLSAALVYGSHPVPRHSAEPAPSGQASSSAERLPGLVGELRIRGAGVDSPRSVTAHYALALARQAPLLGLGYETFNLHLRAQLAQPSSPVAQVVNTAAAADSSERYFDDAHSTYLQVLVGTGGVGLLLWLLLAAAGILVVGVGLWREGSPLCACVLLSMIVFHFYGLFQGMQYVVVTWFLFQLAIGFAMTVDVGPLPAVLQRWLGIGYLVLVGLVIASAVGYLSDRGYRDMKQRYGSAAYLPDERAEFVGFYRPETGPAGEYRWMARRGIVHVTRARPFRLSVTCLHPDLEREPVLLSFRFEGQDAGSLVFRRPGTVEKRFDLGRTGTLRLEVSRTFRPREGDDRELGVAVSAVRWE